MAKHSIPQWISLSCTARPNTTDYYTNSLASDTKSTYSAGQLQFQSFCHKITPSCQLQKLPWSFLLITSPHKESHTPQLRWTWQQFHTQAAAWLHSHYDKQLTPPLQLVLKGIKKTQSVTLPLRHCFFITWIPHSGKNMQGAISTKLQFFSPGVMSAIIKYANIKSLWSICCDFA